jgi:hypothetical protein
MTLLKTFHALGPFLLLLVLFSLDLCGWITLGMFLVLSMAVACLTVVWPSYPDWLNWVWGAIGAVVSWTCDAKVRRFWF